MYETHSFEEESLAVLGDVPHVDHLDLLDLLENNDVVLERRSLHAAPERDHARFEAWLVSEQVHVQLS